jgi:hypothetical protein
MVQTGLVAGDAGRDLGRPARPRLGDEIGIGEEWPRHADHVGRPSARIASATSGVLIRLQAITGMPTSGRSRAVSQAKAARGTEVAIVGTRASCQPMPVFRSVAPAASIAGPAVARPRPRWTVGDQIDQLMR